MSDRILNQQYARDYCEKISALSLTNFCYEHGASGELNEFKDFHEQKDIIRNILNLAQRAAFTSQQTYLGFSDEQLASLKETAENLLDVLQKMRTFHESATPSPRLLQNGSVDYAPAIRELKAERNDLLQKLGPLYEKFYTLVNNLIIWVSTAELSLLREKVSNVETGLQIQLNKLTARIDEQNLISPHALTFDDYAKGHYWASWFWLLSSIIILGSTLYYSHNYIYKEIDDVIKDIAHPSKNGSTSISLFWALILIRIMAVGFLGSFAFWGFRNYKINKHNEVINRVKSASLRTFQDFSDTTKNSKNTHDIVVKKIADVIFDTTQIGYLVDKEYEKGISPSQLIDVILQIKKTD